jgi:glyoxylase-like metal-dependent hydrolase (beta-lactamase superfamily II)
MRRLILLSAAGALALVAVTSAQTDALQTAAKTLGVANIHTLQVTGSGAMYTVGQPYIAGGAWPKVDLRSYVATINYDTGSMQLNLLRFAPTPMPPGGGAPFAGEQRQIQAVSGNSAWNPPAGLPPGGGPQAGAAPPEGGRARGEGGREGGGREGGRGRGQRGEGEGQRAAGPPTGPPAGGPPGPAPQPEAVVAERKLALWATPQGFVKAAIANKATTRNARGGTEVSFVVDGKYKMTGVINAQGQVDRVQTWIDNPVLGDMLVETTYSGYKDFGGVTFPSRIVQTQGGQTSLDVTVSEVQSNPTVNIQAPQTVTNPSPPPPAQVASEKIADGVYYLTGGTHHSAAVEMRDHIVLIETPLGDARALAVIAKAKELIPNKPIRYVVNTHVHFDHSGGLRAAVDEGATIVTHQANRAFYEKAWAAPHTLIPDKLSQSKKKAKFQTVGNMGRLTDGTRTIELYAIMNNPHTTGIIMAYLPKEKILFESDAFTPLPANAPSPALPPAVVQFATALNDNIQRLKLDIDTILAGHGPRVAKIADLRAGLGRNATN